MRRAFPYLDLYLSYGSALYSVIRTTTNRDDIQVVLCNGRIYIGSPKELSFDHSILIGNKYVESTPDDWLEVNRYIGLMDYGNEKKSE